MGVAGASAAHETDASPNPASSIDAMVPVVVDTDGTAPQDRSLPAGLSVLCEGFLHARYGRVIVCLLAAIALVLVANMVGQGRRRRGAHRR